MKKATKKHPELRKSIALTLIFLLAFSGVFVGGSVTGAMQVEAETVTDAVYGDNSVHGAIWTTDVNGEEVNEHHFPSKQAVYLNGGPNNNNHKGLPPGSYYVQITEPNGTTLLGYSTTAFAVVGEDEYFAQRYNLWNNLQKASDDSTGYDTTSNNGGEYKVWVSKNPNFENNLSKTDNFKVKDIITPEDPATDSKLIIKKVVVDENDDVIEEDTSEFTFTFTELKEIDEVFFQSDTLSQMNPVNVYDHTSEMNSVLEEINIPDNYMLIGYEFAEYTQENGFSGEPKIHNVEEIGNKWFMLNASIGYAMWELEEDVTITIINRFVSDDEPGAELIIEKRLLNANNTIVASSDVPFTVEVEEPGESGFYALYEDGNALTVNDSIYIQDLEAGTYNVTELLTTAQKELYELWGYEVDGASMTDDGVVTVTENDLGTSIRVVIVNRIRTSNGGNGDNGNGNNGDNGNGNNGDNGNGNNGDNGNGGNGEESTTSPTTRSTPSGVPAVATTTTVIESVTPLAAPEVEAPVIILDEPVVPLAAPPVLPQTGDPNPWIMVIAGLGVSASGLAMFKRKKPDSKSVTMLFRDNN